MESTKILIIEDEILIAEDLKDILIGFGYRNLAMAHDKKSGIAMIEDFKPQIALLDIRMEGELDGLEIAEYLNANFSIPFIFITAHSDVDTIKKIVKSRPSGYITKPIKKSDLFAALQLASENYDTSPSQLKLKDGHKIVIIDKNKIDYVESEGNYVTIYYENNKLAVRQTMDFILAELSDKRFYKIHRSFIVNINKVSKFSKKDVYVGGKY